MSRPWCFTARTIRSIPPEAGKDTAASIPGAELVIVPGMAHDCTEPLVPIYLKHIGEFVAKVEARAKAA